MIGHIIKLAEDLIKVSDISGHTNKDLNVFNVPKMIYAEIKDLKAIEFDADVRYDFVIIRNQIKSLSMVGVSDGRTKRKNINIANHLIEILQKHNGALVNPIIKEFNFISDLELKHIIERDYRELSVILFPENAWKSVVIMAGSILEAILFDILSNETNLSQANSSEKVPKRNGEIIPIGTGKWSLQKLIEVAVDINIIPNNRASSIDQVLRDYRNFVHPKKEIRSEHQCSEAEALMAKGALDGVYNHLNTANEINI